MSGDFSPSLFAKEMRAYFLYCLRSLTADPHTFRFPNAMTHVCHFG